MRKHDARMIIQRIVAGAFRGTRKAFKAKKLETQKERPPAASSLLVQERTHRAKTENRDRILDRVVSQPA